MGVVALTFGAASAAVLGLSLLTRRAYGRLDAAIMAAVLMAAWGATKALDATLGKHDAMILYPQVSMMVGLVAVVLWSRSPRSWIRRAWLLAIAFASLTRLMVFSAFAGSAEASPECALALNILFAIQLICVASIGGWIVADAILDWMLPGPAGRYGSGASARRQKTRTRQAAR